MFNPAPAINLWFNDKVQRLTTSLHKSSMIKCWKHSDTEFADITELAMSDLEDEWYNIWRVFIVCNSYGPVANWH